MKEREFSEIETDQRLVGTVERSSNPPRNGAEFESLVRALPGVVAEAQKYPEHLQPTIVEQLCMSIVGTPSSESRARKPDDVVDASHDVERALPAVDEGQDWDYLAALQRFLQRTELGERKVSDIEFALVIAYVLERCSPDDYEADAIQSKHVNDAWRMAGRDIPARPSVPLTNAFNKKLLKRVRKGAYKLTSKGENLVNQLIRSGESNE